MSNNIRRLGYIIVGIIMAGMLSSCSNIAQENTAFMNNDMSALMDGLTGQDVSIVSSKIGEPTARTTDGDASLLVWEQFAYRESREMYNSPYGLRPGRDKTVRYQCLIKILMVEDKIVFGLAEGNALACRKVYDRLA